MNCGHKFPRPKRYCVICGEGYGGAKSAAKTQANIRFGKLLMTIGGWIGGMAFYGNHLMGEGSGIGFFTVKNIWENTFTIPGLMPLRGSDIAMGAIYLGSGIFLVGLLGCFAAKVNEPKAQLSSKKKKKKKKPSSGASGSSSKRTSDGSDDKFARDSADREPRELRK